MKRIGKSAFVMLFVFFSLSVTCYSPSTVMAAKARKAPGETKADPSDKLSKANAAFDASKMGDMSGYDPANR